MLIRLSAANRPPAGAATTASPPEIGSIDAGTRKRRSQLDLSNAVGGECVGPLLFLQIGKGRRVVRRTLLGVGVRGLLVAYTVTEPSS